MSSCQVLGVAKLETARMRRILGMNSRTCQFGFDQFAFSRLQAADVGHPGDFVTFGIEQ